MGLLLNFAIESGEPRYEEMVTRRKFDEPRDEVAPSSWTLFLDSTLVHNSCLKMISSDYIIFWHHTFNSLPNDTDLPGEMINLLFAVSIHDEEEFLKVVGLAQQLPHFTSDTLRYVMNHSISIERRLIAVT
jgi:hypothetical protein